MAFIFSPSFFEVILLWPSLVCQVSVELSKHPFLSYPTRQLLVALSGLSGHGF